MKVSKERRLQEGMTKYLRMGNYEETRYSLVASFFKGMPGKILDVGCCQGGLRHYLEPDQEYHGVDGIDNAFPNFTKLDLNRPEFPFPDGSFDGVSCCATLEHLFHPLEILKEMKRVLKDRGRVLVSLPNDKGLSTFVSFFQRMETYDESVHGHHWRFSIGTAREFFGKEFEIVSEKPEFGPFYRKYLFWLRLRGLSTEWFMFGKKPGTA